MAYKDWKLGGSIGEGGQAHVYVATKLDDATQYALKRFKNPKREERSKSEILNMKNIRSLGIKAPEIIDSGYYKEGKPYFVTKYYENKSLEYELNNNCENIDRIEFAKKLCFEIRKMNKAGFIHRDLKPANILLDDKWNPVIADFGLAHNTDEITGHTKSGEPIGSLHYMHPSAFDAKNLDKSLHLGFDGYSFGKIFHHLLTNKQLYGFNIPIELDDYSLSIPDLYIRNKISRAISILLSTDLAAIVKYWNKFPTELDNILSAPFESQHLDTEMTEKLKRLYIAKARSSMDSDDPIRIEPDEVKNEVLSLIKSCKALEFLNELLTDLELEEKVIIKENSNLREVLEGVGVKSNYGIEPLRTQGRKQSLVNIEILIELPRINKRLGISLINNTPNTNIILSEIDKTGEWIDVNENSIEKILVDEDSRIDKSYLTKIEKYIVNTIQQIEQ